MLFVWKQCDRKYDDYTKLANLLKDVDYNYGADAVGAKQKGIDEDCYKAMVQECEP